MSWVEKNRKINNRGGDDYSGLESTLARLFSSHWHDSSTVAGTIFQQSLTRMFNSRWQNCSAVVGTIIQQSLA